MIDCISGDVPYFSTLPHKYISNVTTYIAYVSKVSYVRLALIRHTHHIKHKRKCVCARACLLAVLCAPLWRQCDGDSSFSSDTVREAYGRVCRPRHFVGVCMLCILLRTVYVTPTESRALSYIHASTYSPNLHTHTSHNRHWVAHGVCALIHTTAVCSIFFLLCKTY